MDMEQTTPVEETETIETEVETEVESPEATEVTPTEEVENSPEVNEEGIEGAPQEPAFEPTLTYNFRKETRQIPEAFKAFIKDEETNNMVKELYEKADAMDFMKQGREQARQELTQLREAVTPKLQQLEDTQYFLEKGDVSAALKVSGFSKEHIVNEAIRLLESEGNPNGPRQGDFSEQAIAQRELERQNQMLQAQIQQETYAKVSSEYEQSTSEHAHIINAYDAKFGADSFKTMVAQYGQQQESQGRQLTIADAVREVATNLSGLMPSQSAPAQPQAQQPTNNQPAPKTFPRVTRDSAGSTSSPVAQNLKSFDDLVNLSKNYQAS